MRMAFVVDLMQGRTRHMRVYLGCRYALMSQKGLHNPDISTIVNKVRRKGVSQRVRSEFLLPAKRFLRFVKNNVSA